MSWLYRNSTRVTSAIGLAGSLALAPAVQAAQTHFQPVAELRAETNSNVDLNPDGSPDGSIEGYIADLQVLAGYFTQRGETTVRPRLRLQEYPDRDNRERVEGFLDWVTRYQWERSRFNFAARYAQEDSFNYDTRSGEFDPLDPKAVPESGSGRFLKGETQTDIEVRPSYTYEITERLSAGARAEYQTTDFDADEGVPDQVDYDYWSVNADLRWALDERSTIGFGGYVSQYDAKAGGGDSDGYGVGASYERTWSEVMGLALTLGYQVDDPSYDEPGQDNERSSSVGGSIEAFGEGEVSTWRAYVSQRYAPNGNGRVRQIDLVRLQYDRDLSQRLVLRSAARYESQEQLASGSGSDSDDTARIDVSLRWMITRTWFVQGGYAYLWQEEADEADADNNRFFLGAGYRGLPRDR